MLVDRKIIEEFLEDIENTNYQITATGIGMDGPVRPILFKQWNIYEKRNTYRIQHNGRISPGTHLQRALRSAEEYLRANDPYRAIISLLNCDWYSQVELQPMASISGMFPKGDQQNPHADKAPLVWRRDPEDSQKISSWGGQREGAGRSYRKRFVIADEEGKLMRETLLHLQQTRQSIELKEEDLIIEWLHQERKKAGLE